MKDRLADALASGDTQAVVNVAARMGTSAAAQLSADQQEQAALP